MSTRYRFYKKNAVIFSKTINDNDWNSKLAYYYKVCVVVNEMCRIIGNVRIRSLSYERNSTGALSAKRGTIHTLRVGGIYEAKGLLLFLDRVSSRAAIATTAQSVNTNAVMVLWRIAALLSRVRSRERSYYYYDTKFITVIIMITIK